MAYDDSVIVTCSVDDASSQQRGASLLQGVYFSEGDYHGKPTYSKDVPGGTVKLYYWDGSHDPSVQGWWYGLSDEPSFQGWWFDAKENDCWYTLAFCPGNSLLPPSHGWRMPYNGPVESTLAVSCGGSLCSSVDANGLGCLNPKPTWFPLCVHGMCGACCRAACAIDGAVCPHPRHKAVDDGKTRKERAPRKRGKGWRHLGTTGPY